MKLILSLIAVILITGCAATNGCVGSANHNKKVAQKRHHYRAKHHHHSNNNW